MTIQQLYDKALEEGALNNELYFGDIKIDEPNIQIANSERKMYIV